MTNGKLYIPHAQCSQTLITLFGTFTELKYWFSSRALCSYQSEINQERLHPKMCTWYEANIMCCYVRCSAQIWTSNFSPKSQLFFISVPLISPCLIFCSGHRSKSNRCFRGQCTETRKRSFDCFAIFLLLSANFSCPLFLSRTIRKLFSFQVLGGE